MSIDLSTLQCDTTTDIIFTFSQDNEPDIASSIFSSDAGSFDLVGPIQMI